MIDYIIYTLVFTVITLLIPPLMDGVERKIKASIHSRIGPPITQTWYDLLKLFEKETVIPEGGLHIIIFSLLYIVLTILAMILLISMVLSGYQYVLVVLIALALFIQAIHTTIPFITSNPFAIIGASREVVIALVNEVFFIVLLGLYMYFTGSSALQPGSMDILKPSILILVIALFVSAYVSSGRIPFDIAEAEPELASGALIEFGGPILGVFLYSNLVRKLFFKLLPSILILLPFTSDNLYLLVYSMALSLGLWVLYGVVAALLGRTRVDIAPSSLLKIYIPFIIVSILMYLLGY